jgi:hypothetical protein
MHHAARRRFRAPAEDGAALIDPPLSEVPALVEANRAKLEQFDRTAGFSATFRTAARSNALVKAYGANEHRAEALALLPFILTGHQPELYHPGVWLKNFVASSIAKALRGCALNLCIDTDYVRRTGIAVPSKAADGTSRVVDVPFDLAGREMPWEHRRVLDESVFRQFTAAVHAAFDSQRVRDDSPLLVDRLWDHVVSSADEQASAMRQRFVEPAFAGRGLPESVIASQSFRSVRLASSLTEGRHRLEKERGLTVAELPLSTATLNTFFLTFADSLLCRHRELHGIYNAVLAEYRIANRVRNHLHPIPDLARDGDWYEMPFWLWTFQSKERQRAFVKQVKSGWELTDRGGLTFDSVLLRDSAHSSLPLTDRHIVFRPRALITTMYARLVLSDLFIHGIGGAKYDELTDEIIRRFFGIEPPAYLTATATFRLPIERPNVSADDVRASARRIRDLRFRPESFVNEPLLVNSPAIKSELESLADEKRSYLQNHKLLRGSRDVFAGLDRLNRAMHDLLRPVEEQLRREHARLIEDERRARLLSSREFSFVLFPEDYLVPRLLELSQVPA